MADIGPVDRHVMQIMSHSYLFSKMTESALASAASRTPETLYELMRKAYPEQRQVIDFIESSASAEQQFASQQGASNGVFN